MKSERDLILILTSFSCSSLSVHGINKVCLKWNVSVMCGLSESSCSTSASWVQSTVHEIFLNFCYLNLVLNYLLMCQQLWATTAVHSDLNHFIHKSIKPPRSTYHKSLRNSYLVVQLMFHSWLFLNGDSLLLQTVMKSNLT